MKIEAQQAHTLTIRLFGAPEIRLGESVVPKLPPKTSALLFYLAVTRQTQLRTTLASLLWGDMPEKNARANLRKAIQQLRAALPNHLEIRPQSIGLCDNAEIWVDVVAFAEKVEHSALQDAVGLAHGDFLHGFFVRNAPDFEAWQLTQRVRLREMILGALQTLSQKLVAQNELAQAIVCIRQIVELEPWREEAHRHLMELLAQDGQRAAALRQFDICRQALRDEIAVEPSAETLALYARLQEREEASIGQAAYFVTTTDYTLVGREPEWQLLRSAWRNLSQPHFICVAGEAGIGKTRLAEELIMLAEREGQRMARTRSHALEGRLAYGPVADWLRSQPLKQALSDLDDVWLTEIARLLPELHIEHPDLLQPEPIKDNWQRKRLFEALAHAFTQNRNRLLLVLDDLQWCDNDTLEWLQYLLESADTPLLVVGTVRPQEIDSEHPLHRIRQQLLRLDRCTNIDLNHLTPDATSSLAEQVAENVLGAALAASVFGDTAGNPLFVIESVRAAVSAKDSPITDIAEHSTDEHVRSIPPKMYSVIQSRLARLSPEAAKIAQVAATIGRAFDVELLAHATGVTTEAALYSLDELWHQRIIREVDSVHFDFSHDRIRDVAYGEIGPIQKQLLHKKVVQALAVIYEPNCDSVAGELAEHCRQSKMLKQSLSYYQQAADVAKRIYAYDDVAHYLEEGIEVAQEISNDASILTTTVNFLHQLGIARILTHDWGSEPVAKAWEREYELAKKINNPFYLCRSLIDVATYRRNRGEWDKSRGYIEEALTLVPNMKGSNLISQVFSNCAASFYHMGEPIESLNYFDKALKMEKDAHAADRYEWVNAGKRIPMVTTLVRSAKALGLLGYLDLARQRSVKALQLEQSRGEIEQDSSTWDFSAMLYTFLYDVQMVKVLGGHLLAISTKREFSFYERAGQMFVAWAEAHNGGDPRTCAQIVRDNVDGHRNRGIRMFEPYWRGLLAETLALAEEFEDASTEVHDALAFANECGNSYWNAQLLKQMGDYKEVLSASGEEVESCYQQAIDTARQQQAKLLELRASTSLCRLWQKQGRINEAHQLLANIYGWFTEGFDTVDLKEAKALLGELAHGLTI